MMVSRRQGRRSAGEPEALAGGAVDHHVEDPALPGWPEPLPSALLRMQDRVERMPFTRAEVLALWSKAVRRFHDAGLNGLSADAALESAYAAGRLGALSLLASRHIRIRSSQGHHEMTFAAVAALGLPGLEELQVTSAEVRADRRDADYAPEPATAVQVAHALAWARATLPALHAALAQGDPVLRDRLDRLS